MNEPIHFNDGQYGSGKTTAWLSHIATRALLRNQCVVYPTLKLLRQKKAQFEQLAIDRIAIQAITSDTSARVIPSLVAYFQHAGTAQHRVLFMTYQAWLELPYLHHMEEWEFCFDDCGMRPFVDLDLNLSDQHHLLTNHLEPEDCSAAFSPLRIKPGLGARITEMAENPEHDAVLSVVAKVMRALLLPERWSAVWCNVSNWTRVAAGADAADAQPVRDDRRTLFLRAEVNPCQFARYHRTTFLRTQFTRSLTYLSASRNHGLRFLRHPEIIPQGVPYEGQGLTIHHYQEAIFSKRNRDQPVDGEQTRLDRFRRHIETIHAGTAYGVAMNNDATRSGVRFKGAVAIPPDCAGQEDYAHLTSIALPIALRYDGRTMAFLEHRGITREEANDDLYVEGVAQIIMRSAARQQGFGGEISAHVMDGWVAGRLLTRFPAATTVAVPDVLPPVMRTRRAGAARPGRKRKYATGTERVRAHRARKRAEKAAAVAGVEGTANATA